MVQPRQLLIALGLLLARGVTGFKFSTSWTAADYPNPYTDPKACLREVPSWVCDPDGVMPRESRDVVQGLLNAIADGNKPYVREQCGSLGVVGYQVAVAVMKSFQPEAGRDAAATAEAFATALHNYWGVGNAACNNGAVLLLSIDNRQIFISAGAGTRHRLTDGVLDNIIADSKPLLKGAKYGPAVERAVVNIGLALAGRQVQPEGGGDEGSWWPVVITVTIFAGVGWAAASVQRRKAAKYDECKARLEQLKRDQVALLSGTASYNPTSCPICLDDFDTPLGSGDAAGPSGSSGGGGSKGAGRGPSAAAPAAAAPDDDDDDDDDDGEPSAPPLGDQERSPLLAGHDGSDRGACCGGHLRGGGAGAKAGAGAGAGPEAAPPRLPLVLPCGHAFCERCISEWLQQRKLTCPVCRKPMDGSEPPPLPRMGASGSPGAGPSGRPPCSEGLLGEEDDAAAAAAAAAGGAPGPQQGYRQQQWYRDGRTTEALRLRERMQREALRQELVFRLWAMRRRYPDYITHSMASTWANDLDSGVQLSTSALREFQLTDPRVRAEMASSGRSGARSGWGGGGSGGGGGRGGSW